VSGAPASNPARATGAASAACAASAPLLAVEDLSVEFRTRAGTVRALAGVGFQVSAGELVALVGESGSGKSVTGYAMMGLLDPAGRVTAGKILLRGRDLLGTSERGWRRVRGKEIAMIFQSPRTALNPIRRVGTQIADALARHHGLRGRAARERAVELLARVRIPDPRRRFEAYPFELSGGTCQRVLIALALACAPALLVADEPTTGLDVTTQASIVALLRELAKEQAMAVLLITHDLPLATSFCDRVVVMHAGQVVEDAPTAAVLGRPRHPYTARLLAAVPAAAERLGSLRPIPGGLPDLRGKLPPCRFSGRCERAIPACNRPIEPRVLEGGHRVACENPL
jgi:peptide/nickel transport system ATP-binding protein